MYIHGWGFCMQNLSGKYTFDQLMSALQGTFGCRTSKDENNASCVEMCLFQLCFRLNPSAKTLTIAQQIVENGKSTYKDLMKFTASE